MPDWAVVFPGPDHLDMTIPPETAFFVPESCAGTPTLYVSFSHGFGRVSEAIFRISRGIEQSGCLVCHTVPDEHVTQVSSLRQSLQLVWVGRQQSLKGEIDDSILPFTRITGAEYRQ